MDVPAEKEWGNYWQDLDREYAHRIFAGKTIKEVQPDFRRNVIERTDELRFMPAVPFRYYIIAFKDFIMCGGFDKLDASDAAACFLGLIGEKLRKNPGMVMPVMDDLLPALEYIAEHQDAFEADIKIYGDFRIEFESIRKRYEDLKKNMSETG